MASGEVLRRVFAKDFEYQVGVWDRPTEDGEPAKLQFGDTIESTASVDSFDLGDSGYVSILFRLGKPKKGERFYGWRNSQLQIKAELGDQFVIGDVGRPYNEMAAGAVKLYQVSLDLSGNTNPTHNKLKFTLSDEGDTRKAGLHFYEARVIKK